MLTLSMNDFRSFCFFCGIIGHSENFCDSSVDRTNLPYGPELRASNRRIVSLDVSKYLGCKGQTSNTTLVSAKNMTMDLADGGSLDSSLVAVRKPGSEDSLTGVKDSLDGMVLLLLTRRGKCMTQG